MQTALFFSWRWAILLLSLLLSSSSLYAQPDAYYQAKPDSLRRVLASQRADTARVRTLQHLLEVDQRSTIISYLQQLVPLLKRLRHPQYRAYRRWLAGLQLPQPWDRQPQAALQAALDSLQAAVGEFDRAGQLVYQLHSEVSNYYFYLHTPAAAQAYLSRELAFYQRQPKRWLRNETWYLFVLGKLVEDNGDYNQAIGCYLRALELEQTYNAPVAATTYAYYYGLIGPVYAKWGNYAKAHYYQQALRARLAAAQPSVYELYELVKLEIRIARTAWQQQQIIEALRVTERAQRYQTRLDSLAPGPDMEAGNAYNRVGLLLLKSNLLLNQRQTAAAGRLLVQARHQILVHKLDTFNIVHANSAWARYYAQRGQLKLAVAAWQRAYHAAQKTHNRSELLDYTRQIAQFYQQQQQPALAAPYALEALQLADSLATQQASSLVARYEVVQAERAQTARLAKSRRQQSQAATQAKRQQRALRYVGIGVVGLAVLAGVLYAAFRRTRRLARLVTAQKQDLQQQRDQLDTSLTELRTTQQQLIQKEKLASLGELTAGIAHEIQNPLNFVNNFSEVSVEMMAELEEAQVAGETAEAVALAADVRQNLLKITEHGQRAASIVRGMLAHSRQGGGERTPTNVNALADEYLRLAYHGLRTKSQEFNVELQKDFAADLPRVEAVPGDLGRVLLNLLTNAFYAVQQRQQAGEPGYVPTVGISTRQVGQRVELRVQDNGAGMSSEVRAKVFQPFFTTKPTGEGTGLGLSLSYDIVTKGHRGTLTIESQPGQGTTVIVTLPALPAGQAA